MASTIKTGGHGQGPYPERGRQVTTRRVTASRRRMGRPEQLDGERSLFRSAAGRSATGCIAPGCGVEVDERGFVKVDELMQTSEASRLGGR